MKRKNCIIIIVIFVIKRVYCCCSCTFGMSQRQKPFLHNTQVTKVKIILILFFITHMAKKAYGIVSYPRIAHVLHVIIIVIVVYYRYCFAFIYYYYYYFYTFFALNLYTPFVCSIRCIFIFIFFLLLLSSFCRVHIFILFFIQGNNGKLHLQRVDTTCGSASDMLKES